jgi:hypothetical protein
MTEVLSKSQFAARRGVGPNAVSTWIARRKLSGAALVGVGRGQRINVAEAERQLAVRIDPGRGRPRAEAVSGLATGRTPPQPSPTSEFAIDRGEPPTLWAQVRDLEIRWAAGLDWEKEFVADVEHFVITELPAQLQLGAEGVAVVKAAWQRFRRFCDLD